MNHLVENIKISGDSLESTEKKHENQHKVLHTSKFKFSVSRHDFFLNDALQNCRRDCLKQFCRLLFVFINVSTVPRMSV